MKIKFTTKAKGAIYQDALRIREEVFIQEQQVPRNIEVYDEDAYYFVLYKKEVPIATCRLKTLSSHEVKLQRMAVSLNFRGQHAGEFLLQHVLLEAKKLGFKKIRLGAQNAAINFYKKAGFCVVGAEFIEANIPHHQMVKYL